MIRWNKISLYKFQRIDEIGKQKISEEDKAMQMVCVLFDLTEYQLNNLPDRKVRRYISAIKKITDAEFGLKPKQRAGKYSIDYDISKLNFGQYIDLNFFFQSTTQKAHYALASIVSKDANSHKDRAEYFQTVPVSKVWGSYNYFISQFESFNKEYKSLFDADEASEGNKPEDNFNKRYGWLYSASQVAEYERITLDETFSLPVRRALNDLAYLKAKAKHDYLLRKQKKTA